MEQSLISIIIPVYNGEKYLRPCIDSILHQTYQHWELLLIVPPKLVMLTFIV